MVEWEVHPEGGGGEQCEVPPAGRAPHRTACGSGTCDPVSQASHRLVCKPPSRKRADEKATPKLYYGVVGSMGDSFDVRCKLFASQGAALHPVAFEKATPKLYYGTIKTSANSFGEPLALDACRRGIVGAASMLFSLM